MSDLINRSDAEDLLETAIEDSWDLEYAMNRFKELLSIQPERKTGKWIYCDEFEEEGDAT